MSSAFSLRRCCSTFQADGTRPRSVSAKACRTSERWTSQWLRAATRGFLLLFTVASAATMVGCADAESEPLSASRSQFEAATGDSSDGAADTDLKSLPPAGENTAQRPAKTDQPSSQPPPGVGQPRNRKEVAGGAADGESRANPAAAVAKKSTTKRLVIDPENIPDGTPEELVSYLKELQGWRPRTRNPQELMTEISELITVRVAVADKILDNAEANPELREIAAQDKLSALTQAVQIQFPGYDRTLEKFCRAITKDMNPNIAKLGNVMMVQLALNRAKDGDADAAEEAVTKLEEVLKGEGTPEEKVSIAEQAIRMMQEAGLSKQAARLCRFFHQEFGESEQPNIVDAANQFLEISRALDSDYSIKITAVIRDLPNAKEELFTASQQLLAEKPGPVLLEMVAQAARLLEQLQQHESAKQMFGLIGEAFKAHDNAKVAETAAKMVENSQRRMALIGEAYVVTGLQLDGTEFTSESLKEKIVLVHFWSATDDASLQLIQQLEYCHQLYNQAGLEIVGVNLDRDPRQISRITSATNVPGVIIRSADRDAVGLATPNAVSSGVDSLPFTVLVGKDGNVLAMNVLGEQLQKELEKLFPNVGKKTSKPPLTEATEPEEKSDPAANPPSDKKPAEKDSSFHRTRRVYASFIGADETAAPPAKPASATASPNKNETADNAKPASDVVAEEGNPYSPREDMTPAELADFILNMQEKPKSIQARPGFQDAIVEATERLLAEKAADKFQLVAALAKFDALHTQASNGDQKAEERLAAFVAQMKDDQRPRIAAQVRYLSLEQKVVAAQQQPADQVPAVLDAVREFCEKEKLDGRHVRLASSTVDLINRLEDGDAREKQFQTFGKLFATSSDKQLSRYGRKLAKAPARKESDLIGKPLELAGVTANDMPFDWSSYRGKVVIVDFWATWCGPCVREIPHVKQVYEEFHDRGLDIVGVSLDQDAEALATFLDQHALPWATLAGDSNQELATRYGVRGIPTMMLVDREGKVVAVSHRVGELVPEVKKLLENKAS